MKRYITYRFIIAAFFCCLTTLSVAQKNLDSIINKAYLKVFENPSDAIKSGLSIFDEATSADTKSRALMLVSAAYLSKRDNESSLQYSLKAQQYFKEITDVKSKMLISNAMGMQYQQLRIYDKALDYLDQTLKMAEKYPHKDSLTFILGYNYAVRGFIYREQMSCEIAIGYLDKSISEYKKGDYNKSMNANLSTLTYNKGNCFFKISQIDSARSNFEQSINYAQIVSANSLYAFAKKGLSEVFTVEGNYQQAIKELKEAEEASNDVGDLILNQGIYKNFSDNYLAINDHEKYKIYFEKYTHTQKQILEKEQKTINNSIENLVEENNLQTNNKLSKLQTIQWILIISSIILLFITGNLIFKSRKKYKNAKEKLETLRS